MANEFTGVENDLVETHKHENEVIPKFKEKLHKDISKFLESHQEYQKKKSMLDVLQGVGGFLQAPAPEQNPSAAAMTFGTDMSQPSASPVNPANFGGVGGSNFVGADNGIGRVISSISPQAVNNDMPETPTEAMIKNEQLQATVGTPEQQKEALLSLQRTATAAKTELVPIPIYSQGKNGMKQIGSFMAKSGTRPIIRPEKPTFEEQMKDIQEAFGSDIPKDISIMSNGIIMKLNPSLTGEQAQQKGSAGTAVQKVDQMLSALDSDPQLFDTGSLMATNLPYWLLTPAEQLGAVDKGVSYVKSLYDVLQTEIVSARGGKQLTPTEIEFLSRWLPQAGMSKDVMVRNLNVVKNSMAAVKEGLKRDGSANLVELFNKASGGVNPSKTVVVPEYMSESDAEKAFKEGRIHKGDKIKVNGKPAIWE